MNTKRILADLPEDMVKGLDELAVRKGVSRAELLRRGAALILAAEGGHTSQGDWEQFWGLWKEKPMSDEELQSLKGEWEDPK